MAKTRKICENYEIKFATITLSFNKNNFCQNFVD